MTEPTYPTWGGAAGFAKRVAEADPRDPNSIMKNERARVASNRSLKPDVRNPVLDLPAVRQARIDLTKLERDNLRAVLLDVRNDARAKAESSWRRNKGPMAAYWKAVAVYAGHIERALR